MPEEEDLLVQPMLSEVTAQWHDWRHSVLLRWRFWLTIVVLVVGTNAITGIISWALDAPHHPSAQNSAAPTPTPMVRPDPREAVKAFYQAIFVTHTVHDAIAMACLPYRSVMVDDISGLETILPVMPTADLSHLTVTIDASSPTVVWVHIYGPLALPGSRWTDIDNSLQLDAWSLGWCIANTGVILPDVS